MPTLEDFIKQYLENKKIEDYESWLSKYGQDTEAAYKDAVRSADTTMAAAKSTYGTRASALLSRGLTGSGYGEYLDGVAYAERQKSVDRARAAMAEGEAKNKSAYTAYLDGETENAKKAAQAETEKRSSLFLRLLSQNVEDEESAFAFLGENGLDSETARRLASLSVSMVKNSSTVKREVLETALRKYLSYQDAYEYAISYGLSPAVAEEIARATAAVINATFDPNDYF
ncbi:MAG: hypothetical protein IJY71_06305 [Clostridia bacterium]|nr:hypothetical protein [Clostridia bacterium]